MMEEHWQHRTELLLGVRQVEVLKNAHVLVAGLGGVGGYAIEQLCRAGIGNFTLIDADVVQPSNRNRQIIALTSTIGKRKTEIAAARLREINPEVKLNILDQFLTVDNIPPLFEANFDYALDAIDTLAPKVALLTEAVNRGIKVISSMGSGGKTDPSKITVCDIADSYSCRLAYMVRKRLHAKEIRTGIKVVFSPDKVPKEALLITDGANHKRSIVGTISYMPAIFGCFCAAEIIKDLLEI